MRDITLISNIKLPTYRKLQFRRIHRKIMKMSFVNFLLLHDGILFCELHEYYILYNIVTNGGSRLSYVFISVFTECNEASLDCSAFGTAS